MDDTLEAPRAQGDAEDPWHEESRRAGSGLACCICAVLTRVPLVGGYCASSESPDGCPGRFSNENTLMKAFLHPYGCRRFFEHAWFPRRFGRVGCAAAARARAPIRYFAFGCSFVSWWLMFCAAFALTHDASLLRSVAWARADIEGPKMDAHFDVGIHAVNVRLEATDGSPLPGGGLVSWGDADCGALVGLEAACAQCRDAATGTETFVLLGLLTQLVQITTDLQRSTAYGDINCQKLMGFATSVFGCASGLEALTKFANGCWRKLPSEIEIDSGDTLPADYEMGPGYALMLIAVVAKGLDAICHLLVPTPARKQAAPVASIEIVDYLRLGTDAQQERLLVNEVGASREPSAGAARGTTTRDSEASTESSSQPSSLSATSSLASGSSGLRGGGSACSSCARASSDAGSLA